MGSLLKKARPRRNLLLPRITKSAFEGGRKPWATTLIVLVFAAAGSTFLYQSFAADANLPGDINNDNKVDLSDLSILLSKWNTSDTNADLNNDGKISLADLSILLSNWNKTYTPTTPPTPTPPTPPVNTDRASGLPWSSGVWGVANLGYTNQYISTARGGVPLDNIMQYTSRESQSAQINSIARFASMLPSGFNAARDDFVLSAMTWAGDGSYTTADQGKQIGTATCKIDSSPIVRLDWEMNLNDGAGVNGAMLSSSNYSQWVARFRAVSQGMKSTCPGLKVDFNPNVGIDQTPGCATSVTTMCSRRAFLELKDVVDIYGIDTYDSYPAVTASGSGWSVRLNGDNWLEEARKLAINNGKKFSVPEWGVACNGGGCQWQGNAGGDDPEYIKRMMDYFNAHAGDMSYETYFSETNSYIISDIVYANPSSRAAMITALKLYSFKY